MGIPISKWPKLPLLAAMLAVTAVYLYLIWPRYFWIPVVLLTVVLVAARKWEAVPLAALALLFVGFYVAVRFGAWYITIGNIRWGAGFWYSVLYTLAVLAMGVRFLVVYRGRDRYMKVRTVFNMAAQLFVGFALVFALPYEWRGSTPDAPGFGVFLMYAWPLEINSVLIEKYVGFTTVVRGFLGYSLILSFVALPVLVYFYGRRPYCSWFCGCGCLAETLGDPFRRLTPRGRWSRRLEYSVYPVTLAAVAVTVWVLLTPAARLDAALAGMSRYDLIVKFVLASLLGVGLYSLLGARIWCRYFCPWVGLFGLLAKFGRYAIRTRGELCMACGMCNTYCEMGIDIRGFAMRGEPVKTTTCVGCGMCIEKCPRRVLSFTIE
jgi:Pyruvate/2-oxoacid:ferredoxin oxidoreductase delta subunit